MRQLSTVTSSVTFYTDERGLILRLFRQAMMRYKYSEFQRADLGFSRMPASVSDVDKFLRPYVIHIIVKSSDQLQIGPHRDYTPSVLAGIKNSRASSLTFFLTPRAVRTLCTRRCRFIVLISAVWKRSTAHNFSRAASRAALGISPDGGHRISSRSFPP